MRPTENKPEDAIIRQRLYLVAVIGTIGLGILFRTQGYFTNIISLWLDEAIWAIKLATGRWIDDPIRPPGYMTLTAVITRIYNCEATIRILSYLPGLAVPLLMFAIGRKVFSSKLTTLLAVFLACFHPALIDFTKEFKPYSLELFLHGAIILCTLKYIDGKQKMGFTTLAILTVASIPFATSIIFLLPAVFLTVSTKALVRHNFKKVVGVLVWTVVALAEIIVIYYFYWSDISFDNNSSFWGNKYNVFYTGSSTLEYIAWDLLKLRDLVMLTCSGVSFWSGPTGVESFLRSVFFIFFVVGIWAMFKKRKQYLVYIFVSPFIVLLAFNFARIWPFGPFRANLFMFVYCVFVALYGADFVTSCSSRWLKTLAVMFLSFTMLWRAPFDVDYYTIKHANDGAQHSSMRAALDVIYTEDARLTRRISARIIVVDEYSLAPLRYYTDYHDEYSSRLGQYLREKYSVRIIRKRDMCWLLIRTLREYGDAWIITGRYASTELAQECFKGIFEVLYVRKLPGDNMVALVTVRS